METAMMEGSSNANVFFDTRHRCAKNSAASVAISESAEERNFQDEESVTLSALLGGGGSMASGTSSDVGFSTGVFSRGLAGDSTGGEDSRPAVVNASFPLLGMRSVAPSDAKASTREGVGVVIETERAGRADTPFTSLETSTLVGGSRAGADAATTPSSPIPKLPLVGTGSIVAHERDTASVVASSGDSRNQYSSLRRNLHEAASVDTGVPAGGEDFYELGSRAGNDDAVPLLRGIGVVDFDAAGSGSGARVGGEGRTCGRGDAGGEKGGGRTASPEKKRCFAVLCQAGRQELEKDREESPASAGCFAEGGRGDEGNGLTAADAISAAGAMRPKNPDGLGEENAVHGVANTGGNGKLRNGSTNSNSSSSNSTVTESSGGRTFSDADVVRRQVASLLARVEFLERRQHCLDDAAVAVATTPYARESFPGGGGGSGDTGSFAAAARRRGSWFVSGEAGDCRGQRQTLLTPPPRLARGTEGKEGHAMGVSSTPFTGLDVLFRTPKQQQHKRQLVEQLEHHPPLSPSRARTRWAPSPVPSSPQRSRLTWCAGETQHAVEARGGRAPPRETSGSPPELRLSTDGGDLVASEALEGARASLRRPRSRTEVAFGRSSGEGQDRGNELFFTRRDSGSPRRSRSPLIGPCRGGKGRRAPSPSRLTEEDGVADTTEGVLTGKRREERLSAGSGRDDGYGSRSSSISLLSYLRVEIFGAEDHGEVDTQANRTVRNFLTVPRQLEKLLLFGMLVCLDTFLYVTTFLPIRIVIGVISALFSLITRRSAPKVNRPLLYDWMRGGTIAVSLFALQFLEMSRVYHYIRGQAMVKLYVLTAMMEIFDKLMCSFGQDALDSLYLSTVHKKKRRVLMHFVVVCVTACLHSLLLFIHVTTLTVAVNTSDQALLTLLISNNFAEIKSSVFKKFDKHNLFQLSCHDVVERFKLALFLGMIILLNVCQGGLDDPLSQFSSIFVMVFAGEVLADWIKHGFIIKFNQLTPSIYEEYATILARDVASFRKDDGSALDHTHFVARRLAFATVPLNCVMIRFIQMAVPKLLQRLPSVPTAALWTAGILFYLSALALKVLTGISLMAQACRLHPDAVIFSTEAASWLRSPLHGAHKTRREQSLGKLSTIERFTLWKGRIV